MLLLSVPLIVLWCLFHFLQNCKYQTWYQIKAFLSQAKLFAGRESPLQQSCLHSPGKGGTVEHPSPASSPACALKCRSSKSLEIKGVLGFWRQFSNPSSREKLILTSCCCSDLLYQLLRALHWKLQSYFCWHPPKSVYLLQFQSICLFLPLWQGKKGKNSRKASCCLRGHVFSHLLCLGLAGGASLCHVFSWIFRITANRPSCSVGLGV